MIEGQIEPVIGETYEIMLMPGYVDEMTYRGDNEFIQGDMVVKLSEWEGPINGKIRNRSVGFPIWREDTEENKLEQGVKNDSK